MSDGRTALRADCSRCVGLCCVAPTFAASADFAIDKPAGTPCRNLRADFRCGIHADLRDRGFPGCTVYDCFGAGQRLTQEVYPGDTWRASPARAPEMFAAFETLRHLHELLWYLTEALTLTPARSLRPTLRAAHAETTRLASAAGPALASLDLTVHHGHVDTLLSRASTLTRDAARRRAPGRSGRTDLAGAELRGADLIGRKLRGADLTAATLRGALLIGVDLAGAALRATDLIGADLRAANLSGADLGTALFLTQPQVNAARGDAATVLPPPLTRPRHWPPAAAARPRG